MIYLISLCFSCSKKHKIEYDLVIMNVNLIDGTGANLISNINVYIKDEKIYVIDTTKLQYVNKVIDGTGKYLIPGLFDGHAHTSNYEEDFPRFIHFGVTSIFCTAGSKTTNAYFAEMRKMGEQDSLPAPRVFHTSQHFTMEGRHPVKAYPQGNWIEGETVFYLRDTLQIEALVKQVSKFPIEGIKLTIEDGPTPPFVERIPQAFINKVVKEAKKNGTTVFAHISDNVELAMALKAGINHFVHYTGIDLDFVRDKAMIDTIYEKNTSWVTTMMLDKSFVYALYPEWSAKIEEISLFNPAEVSMLRDSSVIEEARQYTKMLQDYYGIQNPNLENIIKPYVEEMIILNKNGVNMVLGTDTGNRFIFPGYSMHEEMQMMELGGVEPLQVIKMATYNPAKMLKILDTHGTIEEGKFADMILLDKNPLKSIKNTLSINKVFKNGKIQKRLK